MAKNLLFAIASFFISFSLFAADIAVVPAAGDSDSAKVADGLSKELKNLYDTVKDANLSDIAPKTAAKFKKCGTKLKCAREETKNYKKTDFVLFPIVKANDKGYTVTLYIFNKNGKIEEKPTVSAKSDVDSEDLASEVASKLMKVVGNLTDGDTAAEEAEDGGDDSEEKSAPAMSDREKKEILRAAFKAYKAGKGKEAADLFKKSENNNFAEDVNDILQALTDARNLVKSGDVDKAAETVSNVEKKDFALRERGYKELQFVKETNKKLKYNEPTSDDYAKARRLFKSVKKEMKNISVWRDGELKKLEDSMGGTLDEQQKLNEKFEKDEEKQHKAEKKQEKEHHKKIEALRESIENLDAKYRDKLADIDKEIEELNKRLEDDRPAEGRDQNGLWPADRNTEQTGDLSDGRH